MAINAALDWRRQRSLKAWVTRRANGTVSPKPKPVPESKQCPRCLKVQPLAAFGKDRRAKWGCSRLCRACIVEYAATIRAKNVERVRATQKRWRLKHREQWRAGQRRQRARRMATCPERLRAKARARYAKKAAHINRLNALRRAADPERYRTIQRRAHQKRRARLAGASIEHIDYDRIRRRDKMVCHICRMGVSEDQLHFDHVIPLAKGGEHSERNISVSHAVCNQRKNDRVITLF